jgi:hypothetical protein
MGSDSRPIAVNGEPIWSAKGGSRNESPTESDAVAVGSLATDVGFHAGAPDVRVAQRERLRESDAMEASRYERRDFVGCSDLNDEAAEAIMFGRDPSLTDEGLSAQDAFRLQQAMFRAWLALVQREKGGDDLSLGRRMVQTDCASSRTPLGTRPSERGSIGLNVDTIDDFAIAVGDDRISWNLCARRGQCREPPEQTASDEPMGHS